MVVALLISVRSDLEASVFVPSFTIANLHLPFYLLSFHYFVLRTLRYYHAPQQVDSERSNKGLQAYWEEVIYIRKKLAVKRTHVLGSLSILDKAGKYNVGNVISERLSDSFHVDVSPTSKHILDSTSSEKTKKIRNEESCQGENDEKRKQTKRHKEQKKKSFSKTRGDVLPNGTKITKPSL
ncbi:hypothetical protein C2G38_1256413 [Gigaspora rosea]|uniref:Uncharacterized protein n=1 Tax=Gigaspora rosea TaxID=44941 RepID=A0A397VAW4_9GLOM|nr:hypothetical protein C2G38_1256413 [Gigaspora rosea]